MVHGPAKEVRVRSSDLRARSNLDPVIRMHGERILNEEGGQKDAEHKQKAEVAFFHGLRHVFGVSETKPGSGKYRSAKCLEGLTFR